MNTIVSTILIAAPIAFMIGWVLSKVLSSHFSHGTARQGQAARRQSPEGSQPSGVDDRDAQIAELQRQLDMANARIIKSKRSFRTWRERIRPIAQQFRQQRMIISELRDELRRRDAAAQQVKEPQSTAAKTPAKTPAEKKPAGQSMKSVSDASA